MDVAYEYSRLLKNNLDLLNNENNSAFAVPTESHIFSELLVHQYGYIVFDMMPVLQKILPDYYNSLKSAEINAFEKRTIVKIGMYVFKKIYIWRYL